MNEDNREGYVPNVVYTCGYIVHNGELVIPFGIADKSIRAVAIDLNQLIRYMQDCGVS